MATDTVSRPALGAAAAASIGAGFVHAAVIGSHSEIKQLAVLFALTAVFQTGWGLLALWRPSRPLAVVGVIGNGMAFGGWMISRMRGISFIDGLEAKEAVGFIDAVCAGLGLAAAILAFAALMPKVVPARLLSVAPIAILVAAFTGWALMVSATSPHDAGGHSHGTTEEAAGGHAHGEGEDAAAHEHADGEGEDAAAHEHADGRPRTRLLTGTPRVKPKVRPRTGTTERRKGQRPTATPPMEQASTPTARRTGRPGTITRRCGPGHGARSSRSISAGCPESPPKQEAYGVALVAETLRDLPRFADTADAVAAGYKSIGDSSTGYEHYINYGFISDGKMLDSTAPESLVYQVDGDKRTIASAMYIAESEYPFGSKQLDKLMGGLVTWHNHDNLCWTLVDGQPKVAAVTDNHGGVCPEGHLPGRR